jgi:hypoxanthine phosphoribosyltransferase
MEKIYLTWSDIDYAVKRLAINIKASNIEISAIKGLQRGGLIPAVMLSHLLDIPMTEKEIVSSSILIVDDICDTGNTLLPYKQTNNPIVTIHYKTSALFEPNFWYKLTDTNTWLVYPWEKPDADAVPDYLKRPIM